MLWEIVIDKQTCATLHYSGKFRDDLKEMSNTLSESKMPEERETKKEQDCKEINSVQTVSVSAQYLTCSMTSACVESVW